MFEHFRSYHLSPVGMMITLVLMLGMVTPLFADVPIPSVPHAKGEQCVEDTAFMRRNHMEILKHQRDETMHKGIRTKKHSLQNCLNCHAVYDEQKQVVDIKNEKHFCNSCHAYAAVKIDCFGCHNSKPFVNKPPRKVKSGI